MNGESNTKASALADMDSNMPKRLLRLFVLVLIGIANCLVLMILVKSNTSMTQHISEIYRHGTSSTPTDVPPESKNTSDLKIPASNQKSANQTAHGQNISSAEVSVAKDLFQSIHQIWSFNATAADELRSLMEKNCNTTQMLLTTQNNVIPNEFLHYEAEKNSRLNITPDVYSRLIREIPYYKKSFKKCSIVGSSGYLLDSKCGQSIDTADFVVRFNLAEVRNFSGDVGSKTDLVTCNPTLFQRTYKLNNPNGINRFKTLMKNEYGNASLYISAFTYRMCTKLAFKAQDVLKPQNVDVVFPHPRHITMAKRFWKKRIKEVRITSGLLLFTAAMSFCEELHLYGFWPFPVDPEGNQLYYHYFDKSAIMLPPAKLKKLHHNMPEEFKMFVNLHNKGAIRLHVGRCNTS